MHSWLVKVKGGLSAKEKGKAATKLFLELELQNKSATKKAKTGGGTGKRACARSHCLYV
jgi:hypothetical protein